MKIKKVTLGMIITVCAVMIAGSWFFVLRSKSAAEKQIELIEQAKILANNGIYIKAVPLLEEAAGYDSAHTITAEEELKSVYLALSGTGGYNRKYTNLLDKQMERKNAPAYVFEEAANYQLQTGDVQNALEILKKGIEQTSDSGLTALYESERYAYDINRNIFEDVTAVFGNSLQVQQDGKWGISDTEGKILIPCQYDKISTLHQNRAIVMMDGMIYAVDQNNNRIAIAPDGARDFRNLSEDRTAILTETGWYRATGELEQGTYVFEDIGMYSGGYTPARKGGKWGIIDMSSKWLIPAQYDEVIQDELGRCYAQEAAFVRNGEYIYLFSNGEFMKDTYQGARPFTDEGYAAVCRNGKWGFIDTQGNIMIEFLYDDAFSFGGHMAAVKKNDSWGYISLSGEIVIEMIFADAGSFQGGSAPVKTEKGWQLITLVEYKKERKLL